jgi:hypothetical protein
VKSYLSARQVVARLTASDLSKDTHGELAA